MGLKIDAAFQRNDNQRVYFFIGEYVYRYDLEISDKLDAGYPQKIKDYWPGLPYDRVDAVFKANHADKLYFFSGNTYVRYDIYAEKVDEGYPKNIKENWHGVPYDSVDTACARMKVFVDIDTEIFDKVLLFKGDEYVAYNLDIDRVADGYPKKIKDVLMGLPFDRFDAIFQHLDHPLFYIFRGDEYIEYDFEFKKVKERFPKKIADRWKGIG